MYFFFIFFVVFFVSFFYIIIYLVVRYIRNVLIDKQKETREEKHSGDKTEIEQRPDVVLSGATPKIYRLGFFLTFTKRRWKKTKNQARSLWNQDHIRYYIRCGRLFAGWVSQ